MVCKFHDWHAIICGNQPFLRNATAYPSFDSARLTPLRPAVFVCLPGPSVLGCPLALHRLSLAAVSAVLILSAFRNQSIVRHDYTSASQHLCLPPASDSPFAVEGYLKAPGAWAWAWGIGWIATAGSVVRVELKLDHPSYRGASDVD